MRQWEYAKEPFDFKLFVCHILRRWHWVLLGALVGLLCIGGGYYIKNVTLADPAPYRVVDKYYVEYGVDPQILVSYSYFAGFTWDDWIKSDEWVNPVLNRLDFAMTKEELVSCLQAEIMSDVRVPYLTVTHPEREKALAIAEAYRESMIRFGETQKELVSIRLMDTEGPEPENRDVRVFRACVLGILVGAFLSWFFIGLFYLMDERVYVPEQLTLRYGVPAAGYLTARRKASPDLESNLKYLLRDKNTIGVVPVNAAVDPELLKQSLEELDLEKSYVGIGTPLQTPENGETLRQTDGNVLLISAKKDGGKAVQAMLHFCKVQDVPVTAVILVDASEGLIDFYRFRIWRSRR